VRHPAAGQERPTTGWRGYAGCWVSPPAGTTRAGRRFDDVQRRIDDLPTDMNARFTQVEAHLSELREDLREIRGLLQEALRARAA